MITSQDFLKQKIDYLVELFPTIQISYEYDPFDDDHVIEILPREIYQTDNRLLSEEVKMMLDFSKEYPYEMVVFCTEGDIIAVESPSYIRKGYLYESNKEALDKGTLVPPIFEKYKADIPSHMEIHGYPLINENSETAITNINCKILDRGRTYKTNYSPIFTTQNIIISVKEEFWMNNYQKKYTQSIAA